MTTEGRVMANKHSTNGCPKCGSAIYVRKNESNDAARECADCGASYRVRLSPQQRALIAEAEAENE